MKNRGSKGGMGRALAVVLTVAGSSAAVEDAFERYAVIIQRAPFRLDPAPGSLLNEVPVGDTGNADPVSGLRLCFLLESDAGERRAGFENMQARPGEPKSMILAEGHSFRGVLLDRVDVSGASVVLSRGGELFLLEISDLPEPSPSSSPKPVARRLVPQS
jgi:hypothetical protein